MTDRLIKSLASSMLENKSPVRRTAIANDDNIMICNSINDERPLQSRVFVDRSWCLIRSNHLEFTFNITGIEDLYCASNSKSHPTVSVIFKTHSTSVTSIKYFTMGVANLME